MGRVSQNLAKGRLQEAARRHSESKNELAPDLTPSVGPRVRSAQLDTTTSRPCALAIPSNPGSPLFATLPDRCAFPQITADSLARSRGRFSFKPAGRIAIAADPE